MKFEFKKFKSNTLGGIIMHLILAAGLLLLLSIAYFYAYLPGVTHHGETITVPNIEGMPLDQWQAELEKRTLRYEINDSSYSSEYPPLTVLKQYPHADAKVKEGRKIFVTVNSVNPPTALVPNLVDGSVVNADAVLRSNELKRGKIELVPGPFNVVKEMKYKGQLIEAGKPIPKGSVIDLVVMDGGGELAAPDVVGLSFEDAKIPILGSDLNIGDIHVIGDTTATRAVIIRQKPEAGKNIKAGDIVELWIGEADSDPDEND